MARYAAIDVGTNTVLLLVAEPRAGRFEPVLERMRITRLGKGVDATGRFDDAALLATVDAIVGFADEARAAGAVEFVCAATSAARDAANGAEFCRLVAERAGVVPEIISGALEARLSYEATLREVGAERALAIVDIGGGSTEITFEGFSQSFDIGSVRLTESHAPSDPPSAQELSAMRERIACELGALPTPPAMARLVGIAGTVTTIAAVVRQVAPYDPAKLHLSKLARDEIEGALALFTSLPLAERAKLIGMEPKRADVIIAGTLILLEVMERLGTSELVVSDRGLRWGLLYQRFGAALAAT